MIGTSEYLREHAEGMEFRHVNEYKFKPSHNYLLYNQNGLPGTIYAENSLINLLRKWRLPKLFGLIQTCNRTFSHICRNTMVASPYFTE